jgi:hypothetical protein
MPSERSRLLLLLVLLSVVAAAGWTTAFADGKTGLRTAALSPNVSKPPAVPTSGEPDVGQTPRPTPTKGALSPVPRGGSGIPQGPPAGAWFHWIFRMWKMRYLGAR